MEINFRPNAAAVVRTAPPRPSVQEDEAAAPRPATVDADAPANFENANALDRALHETPVSRSEFVKRGAELIGDVNYPPKETISKISHLLAMRLYAGDGSDAETSG